MKIVSIKKWAALIACVCSMGLASQVSALDQSSAEYIGLINPNIPSNPANEVSYINALIALAPGGSTAFSGQTLTRSANVFASLPTAVLAGSTKDDTSPSTSVDVTGYTYLLGKYDASQAGALVFYVGNLTGIQTIPGTLNGLGLSHWSLYNPGGTSVPDGGSSLALLGAAVAGIGFLRRKLS